MNQSLTDRQADRQSADGWELGLILLCSREVTSGSFRYPAGTAPLLFYRQRNLLTRRKISPRHDVWREGNLPGSHLTNSKVTQPHQWDIETMHSTFAWFAAIQASQARNVQAAPGLIFVLRRGAELREEGEWGGERGERVKDSGREERGGNLNWN